MDWSSKGRFAAKRRTDGYDVEMAIPLKSLGVESVKPGDKWGVNFNRCRGNISSFVKESRFTCWSPTYGGFNRPNEFGVVLMD
jgi:hypothetical protein